MENTCKNYTAQDISRFFDNEIPKARYALIKSHLVHCEDCSRIFEQYQSIATGFNDHVDQQVTMINTVEIRQKLNSTLIHSNKTPRAMVSKFFNHHLSLKLACLAAIVLISLLPFQTVLFGSKEPSAIVKSVDTDFASVMIFETQKEKHTIIWFSET